ncbi:MAG: hypothetical protein U0U46_11435 [Saprospiraceae bacterium]
MKNFVMYSKEHHFSRMFIREKNCKSVFLAGFFLLLTGIMTAQSLLIDVSVSNTAPGASDVFNYKIRYRCASITEHCYNSTITYTIPDALEIISAPSPGGNITNVAVSGNTVTVSLASPPSAGAPAGALAAGSSGLFLTGVRFKCGTNGTPPVPVAGTPVNFTPAGLPVFSASAMSVTAAAPADVTTPTVSACVPPPGPIPPPTDLIKLIQNGVGGGSDVRGVVMPGENTYYYLNIPTHNASTVFTDMFPTGFHLVETSADFPNFFTGTGYKLEVFSNGTWWEITNGVLNRTYKGYQYWLGDFATGAPLLDDFGNDIGSTKMTKTFFNGSTSSWGSNITGFRITTGNMGLNPGLNTYFNFHVEDNVAAGDYENCVSVSRPGFSDLLRYCRGISAETALNIGKMEPKQWRRLLAAKRQSWHYNHRQFRAFAVVFSIFPDHQRCQRHSMVHTGTERTLQSRTRRWRFYY